MTNIKLIFVFASIFFSVNSLVIANDNLDFIQVLKQNQGKFSSEIKDENLFDREFLLRVKVIDSASSKNIYASDIQEVSFKYDDGKQELSFDPAIFLNDHSFLISQHCKKTGSGIGKTALGIKMAYIKRSCNNVMLIDNAGIVPGRPECNNLSGTSICRSDVIRISASPAEFRAISNEGLEVEYRVRLYRKTDGPLVEFETDYKGPSLDYPFEHSSKNWTVTGTILEVRWFRPRGSEPIIPLPNH